MMGFFNELKLVIETRKAVFSQPDVLRLGEGGDFTTEHYTKHTLQIYEKLSYEALPRHFCQTAVISWPSV
jgi:hypothetical protein